MLALKGLAGPSAVIVADNGSTDGSLDWLSSAHPEVQSLDFEVNLGFAEGNNRAAAESEADYVLFLNNDTVIAPDALAWLVEVVQAGATCAGARLVSWDSRCLDFDGGGASFTGHGHAFGYGHAVGDGNTVPQGETEPRAAGSGTPTLFTSGAAMLIHRRTFLDLGGFDPTYFAYYEDVNLGWRLNLSGHKVVQLPAAIVRHFHGGTAGVVSGLTGRLFERNALMTVAKNYDDVNARRVLPAALALAAVRAGADPDVITAATGLDDGAPLPVPHADWAGWSSLAPLDLEWPAIAAARAKVQARRTAPDAQVIPLLGTPYAPVPPDRRGWQALSRAVHVFGLEDVFGPWRPSLAARLRYGV